MPKLKTELFRNLVLEVPSIVIAVLLALTLDAWQEANKKEARIQQSLTEIKNEIFSFAGLDLVIDINEKNLAKLTDEIAAYEETGTGTFSDGIARPGLTNLAWVGAKENDIASGFDRRLFSAIAFVYEERDRLQGFLDYASEFDLSADPDMHPYKYARHKRKQLDRIVFRSKEVKRKATDFIEEYKDEPFMNN